MPDGTIMADSEHYAKGGEVDIHKYVWKVKLKSGETITKDEFIENYDGNFKYVQNIILNNKKPVSVEWYLDNYKEGDLYGNPTYAKGGGVDYESMSKQELVDSYMKKVSAHLDKLTDEEVIDEYKDWFDVWDEFEEEDSHKSISQLKQELLDDEENAKLDYDKDELIYIQDSYAKGGLVKKSDFTMLGLGALGGMLIAILKK
jgi:hypothetical protein